MTDSYYTTDEAKQIADTMIEQIGWNTRACIGANNLLYGQWRGPGTVTMQIKTRNCAQRNRYVEVTYDSGQDLYKVEAVNITKYTDGRGAKRNIVWDMEGVFCDMLSDVVLEAADWTATKARFK